MWQKKEERQAAYLQLLKLKRQMKEILTNL